MKVRRILDDKDFLSYVHSFFQIPTDEKPNTDDLETALKRKRYRSDEIAAAMLVEKFDAKSELDL